MAVYNKKIEAEYRKVVEKQYSFDTLNGAKEFALEHFKDMLAPTIWKGNSKYFVVPHRFEVEFERLDFEQVVDLKRIITLYHSKN